MHLFKVLLCSILTPLICSSALADESLKNILARKSISIAASPVAPYYFQDDKSGKWKGFEYALAVGLIKDIDKNIKIDIQTGKWEQLPEMLDSGKADVLINGYYAPMSQERKEKFLWSECYYNTGLGLLFNAEHKMPISNEEIQQGKIVIFPESVSQKWAKSVNAAHVSELTGDAKYTKLLLEKKIDFVAYDQVSVFWMAFQSKGKLKTDGKILQGTEGCYRAWVKKENKSLLDAINIAIKNFEKSSERTEALKEYKFN